MNPFKPNSTQFIDFETMSDLNWHCTKCEFKKWDRLKTWQVWKDEKGIQLGTGEDGHFYKKILCKNCNQVTIHRKLISTSINEVGLLSRSGIPKTLSDPIKKTYNFVDEYSVRTESPGNFENHHRVPQVRWSEKENKNDNEMTDSQIKKSLCS